MMERWKKVCNFANGVVYASGNRRRLIIPNHPDIFFEVDKKEVRWHPGSGNSASIRQGKMK